MFTLSRPWRRLALPLLLVLAWSSAQLVLAWHAPSHISDGLGSHLSASQDCEFGVNSHGAAAIGQTLSLPVIPATPHHASRRPALASARTPLTARARAPPALI